MTTETNKLKQYLNNTTKLPHRPLFNYTILVAFSICIMIVYLQIEEPFSVIIKLLLAHIFMLNYNVTCGFRGKRYGCSSSQTTIIDIYIWTMYMR